MRRAKKCATWSKFRIKNAELRIIDKVVNINYLPSSVTYGDSFPEGKLFMWISYTTDYLPRGGRGTACGG